MSGSVIKRIRKIHEEFGMKVEPCGDTFELSVFVNNGAKVRPKLFSLYLKLACGTLGFKTEVMEDGYKESFVIPTNVLTESRRKALSHLVSESSYSSINNVEHG